MTVVVMKQLIVRWIYSVKHMLLKTVPKLQSQ